MLDPVEKDKLGLVRTTKKPQSLVNFKLTYTDYLWATLQNSWIPQHRGKRVIGKHVFETKMHSISTRSVGITCHSSLASRRWSCERTHPFARAPHHPAFSSEKNSTITQK